MGQGGQSSQGGQGSHGQSVGVWVGVSVSVFVVVLVSVVRVGGHEVGDFPGPEVVVVSVVVFSGTIFVEVLVTAGGCPGAEVIGGAGKVVVVVKVFVDAAGPGKVVVNVSVVWQLMIVAHEAWKSDAPSFAAATLSAKATPAIKGAKNWDGMRNLEIQ